MVFSFFSFALNWFIIAYRAFRRTVSLDVSGLNGCNDRQAVSKFTVDHFAQYNIHEVQFIGMVVKVTFAAEARKQQVLSHQVININGILCAVRGDGPRAQNALVYNYPVEGNEELIRRKLGAYGVIKNISFCHWTHLENVSDEVRVVRMVRSAAIPCHVSIGDFSQSQSSLAQVLAGVPPCFAW